MMKSNVTLIILERREVNHDTVGRKGLGHGRYNNLSRRTVRTQNNKEMTTMKTTFKVGLIVAVGLLAGCATVQNAQVWTSPQIGSRSDIAYSIDPFEDANAKKDKENFPHAAKVVSEAFETAFLQSGYRVVSKGKEDAYVTGTLKAHYRGSFTGRYTTVGFDVKATDSKRGETLWKASHSITTGWDYDYDPAVLAGKVARELVQKLNASAGQ